MEDDYSLIKFAGDQYAGASPDIMSTGAVYSRIWRPLLAELLGGWPNSMPPPYLLAGYGT